MNVSWKKVDTNFHLNMNGKIVLKDEQVKLVDVTNPGMALIARGTFVETSY